MPCDGQHFITGISLHGGKLPISSMVHGSECSLGIRCMCISCSPSLLCLWHCRWPLIPEVFFDGVQDFLLKAFFWPLFTATPPRQLLQLIDVPVQFCYLLLGGVRANKLHSSSLCHQVSFHWWFPSAPADCAVMPNSGWLKQHGETSAEVGSHGEACWVSAIEVPWGKHWHLATSLLPSLKWLFPLLASLSWQSWWCSCHISN